MSFAIDVLPRPASADDVAGLADLLVDAVDSGASVSFLAPDRAAANQPHRAEVAKLLVHRRARRRGIGRALMIALEAEAARAQRPLLTLDTRRGDAAEQLYHALGWTRAGAIPDYALTTD